MKRVFAHIGFSFAVSMLVLNLITTKYVLILAGGLAILLIASLLIKKYRQALAVPVCLGAAVFACLIFSFTQNYVVAPQVELDSKTAECEFYITDLPQKTEDGKYSYTVKTTSINLPRAPQNIKLRLKSDYPIYSESYKLIKGNIRFYKIGSNAFSSYGYWSKDIFLSSRLENYTLSDTEIKSPMKYIIKARRGIKTRLSEISGDEGALSIALIIGDKTAISQKLSSNFKFAGASHLMAVSGLHLSAISGFILFILKRLRIKDKLSYSLTIAVIIYYAALCGFSKSVVRAGIMMIVLLLGKIINRHSDPLNSLGLAAFIICINPFAVSDMGAVLSILSVLSLSTAFPVLNEKIMKLKITKSVFINKCTKYVLNAIAASFCILAYTICAMFVFFGYVSVVSLISGVALVFSGSIATILALITNFAIMLKIGAPFIFLSRIINRFIIFIVNCLASFRLSVITFENYFGFVACLILIIFAFCFIINKRFLKTASVISALLVIVCLVSMAFSNNNDSFVYLSSSGATAICSDGKTVVFAVKNKSDYYAMRNFLTARRKNIDYLIVNQNSKYNRLLEENFECEKTVYKNCSENITDGFSFSYKAKDKTYYFEADIGEHTLINSNLSDKKSDILIENGICSDKNGIIDLSDGDIIYSVTDKNYSARRVDIWQE